MKVSLWTRVLQVLFSACILYNDSSYTNALKGKFVTNQSQYRIYDENLKIMSITIYSICSYYNYV